MEKLKAVIISDTHTRQKGLEIPEGDLLIHSGDFCGRGEEWEALSFLKWIGRLSHKRKIVVAGNHDFPCQTNPVWFLDEFKARVPGGIYLNEESCEIEGIKFYGSPWTTWFYDWAFNLKREPTTKFRIGHENNYTAEECWAKIPEDTQVLITHGPRYGILDTNEEGQMCGDKVLRNRIAEINSIRFHIHGHIHHGYGIQNVKYYRDRKFSHEVMHINAAVLDDSYKLINKPIIIDI